MTAGHVPVTLYWFSSDGQKKTGDQEVPDRRFFERLMIKC